MMRNFAKRAISLLCVLSMLFSMLITVQASSDIKLTVESIIVEKGTGTETVDIPIVLSGNTGLIGMTMTVNYAEGLTLTKVTKGDALSSLTLTKPGDLSANPVKATWDGEGENDYGNGTIITFSFTVPKNVEKEYPIEISISGAIDENLAQVSKVIENGKITVGSQAHSHSFGEWEKISDSQHQRKCDCGETETEGHTWNDGVVTTPATQTTTGVKTYTCSVCNGTKTEIIPKLDNETPDGVKFTVGSVSVEKGTGSETVDVPIVLSGNTGLIGMTMTVNYAEGLTLTKVTKGDALSSLTLTKPGNLSANPVKATWDGEGENDYGNGTIITFSFTVPKNVEKEYPIEISISGAIDESLAQVSKVIENGKITVGSQSHTHTFGKWTKVDENNHKRVCECNEEEIKPHNWNDGVVTTPATHTATGIKTYTCPDCSATKTETIDKTPTHSHGSWVKDNDDTHSKTCACGDVVTENHNWNAGTITANPTPSTTGSVTYTCLDCSATKTETIDAEAIFTLSDVTGKPGDTVKVKLSLKTDKDINSIAVSEINYDSSILSFAGFSDYEHIEDLTVLPPTFDDDKKAIVIGLKKAEPFDGDICTLNFKIKDEIEEECSTTITATPLVKKSSTIINSFMKPALVTVRLQLLGDIDCNDTVDIDDAIALFQYSMLPDIYPIGYMGSVDFDKNGEVDIDDAILLFQYSMLPDIYPIE